MKILDLVNELSLKITFFEVGLIISIYVKFQQLEIYASVLEIEHTPGFVLTSRV